MASSPSTRNTAMKRIQADVREITKHPSCRYYAEPLEDNMFEWHFTIRGPAGSDFQDGLYHGRILLPSEYPFKPPNIIFLTKNGRFEVGTKICLSISAHHPEAWQPAWGVRTMLEAIISFLPTEGNGAIGALEWSPEERRKLAAESHSFVCSHCGPVKDIDIPERGIDDEQLDADISAQVILIALKFTSHVFVTASTLYNFFQVSQLHMFNATSPISTPSNTPSCTPNVSRHSSFVGDEESESASGTAIPSSFGNSDSQQSENIGVTSSISSTSNIDSINRREILGDSIEGNILREGSNEGSRAGANEEITPSSQQVFDEIREYNGASSFSSEQHDDRLGAPGSNGEYFDTILMVVQYFSGAVVLLLISRRLLFLSPMLDSHFPYGAEL